MKYVQRTSLECKLYYNNSLSDKRFCYYVYIRVSSVTLFVVMKLSVCERKQREIKKKKKNNPVSKRIGTLVRTSSMQSLSY